MKNKEKIILEFEKDIQKSLKIDNTKFKLNSIYFEVIFNDYDRIEFFFNKDLTIDNLKNQFSILLNGLLTKENCDSTYSIEMTKFFEIMDDEFIQLTNISNEFHYHENENIKKHFNNKNNILKSNYILFQLETPKANKPKNLNLIKKINEKLENVINVNGDTNYEYIKEIKELLNKF
jgi:hypothetical protein